MNLLRLLSVALWIGLSFLTYQKAVLASTFDCKECVKTPNDNKCQLGHYLKAAPGPECTCVCARCDICGVDLNMHLNHERQACGAYSNTVCCRSSNMIVIDGACHPEPAVATGSATHQSPDKSVTNPGNHGGVVLKTKIVTLLAVMAAFACAFNG